MPPGPKPSSVPSTGSVEGCGFPRGYSRPANRDANPLPDCSPPRSVIACSINAEAVEAITNEAVELARRRDSDGIGMTVLVPWLLFCRHEEQLAF
jgi:hypothetical protein